MWEWCRVHPLVFCIASWMCVLMCDAQQPSVCVYVCECFMCFSFHSAITSPHSSPANPVIVVQWGRRHYIVYCFVDYNLCYIYHCERRSLPNWPFLIKQELDKARKNAWDLSRQCLCILSFPILWKLAVGEFHYRVNESCMTRTWKKSTRVTEQESAAKLFP